MQEQRLFRLAPEAFTASAHFVPGEGWHCTVQMRRGDETWLDAYRADYDHLSTGELVDILDAECATLMARL
jgi:hypothetical protein